MAKKHSLLDKITTDDDVPFWKIVYEKRAAGLQYSLALFKSQLAPFDVVTIREVIVHLNAICF